MASEWVDERCWFPRSHRLGFVRGGWWVVGCSLERVCASDLGCHGLRRE